VALTSAAASASPRRPQHHGPQHCPPAAEACWVLAVSLWMLMEWSDSSRRVWLLLLLLVWHAPLRVCSVKRRHQSPEWTIMSHSYRLIQWQIVWSQVLLDSLHPRSSRTSSEGEAVMILLASWLCMAWIKWLSTAWHGRSRPEDTCQLGRAVVINPSCLSSAVQSVAVWA